MKGKASVEGVSRERISADRASATAWFRGGECVCALIVFLAALLIRALYLLEMHDTPLFTVLMGDAGRYDAWARRIADGAWFGGEVFYQAPFYPYFLALLYKALGHDVGTVRVVQILIGSASCALLVMAGRRFLSLRVGVIAGILLAVYPPALFFDGLIQKAVFGLFFLTLLLVLLGQLMMRIRWVWAVLAGIVLGLLALTRENALILVPIVVLWLPIQFRREPLLKRFLLIGAFVAGLLVVLFPVGLRNKALGGKLLLTTSQMGPNFFIGNNLHANGLYMPLRRYRGHVSFERQDAIELAEADLGRSLTPAEASRYWMNRSLSYIREHPAHWCRLMLKKWLLVWNTAEVGDTESLEAYRDSSTVLRVLGWGAHFGVVCPLAVVGLWGTRHHWRRLALLYCIVLCMALGVALFFVFARYRYPMVAVLLLFAAAGLLELIALWRHRAWAPLAVCLVLLVATAVVTNWRQLPEMYRFGAFTYTNLGGRLAELGRLDEALRYHRKALAIHPNLAQAHYSLAIALGEQGHIDEAVEHFERVLVSHPDHAQAHYLLAIAYRKQGKLDEAIQHLQEAVILDPGHVNAHSNLGAALNEQGKPDEAIRHFQKAVDLDPNHVNARYNLGSTLARQGRFEEAGPHLEAVLRINPDDAEARQLLHHVRSRLGEMKEGGQR